MKEKYYADTNKKCGIFHLFFCISDFCSWAAKWSTDCFELINVVFGAINIGLTIGAFILTITTLGPILEQGGLLNELLLCILIVLITGETFVIMRLLSVIIIKLLVYITFRSYFPKKKVKLNENPEYKLFYEVENEELRISLDYYVQEYFKSKSVYTMMEREDEFVSKMSIIDKELRTLVSKYHRSFNMDSFPKIVQQLKTVITSATEYTQKLRKSATEEYNLQFQSDMKAIRDFIGLKG